MPTQVRQRAFHHKTHTGCKTCKRYHIKCDEAKPICFSCQKYNRDCLGYGDIDTNNPQKIKQYSFKQVVFTPKAGPCRPDLGGFDQSQLSVLRYFSCHSIPLLDRFYQSIIWRRESLQLIDSVPMIRKVAALVGMRHLQNSHPTEAATILASGKGLQNLHDSTMRQWISYIAQPDRNPTVVALVCVLFVVYESLRGQTRAILLHIEAGLRVADQLDWSNSTIGQYLLKALARIGQNSLFHYPRAPLFSYLENCHKFTMSGSSNLDRLRSEVDKVISLIWSSRVRTRGRTPPRTIDEQLEISKTSTQLEFQLDEIANMLNSELGHLSKGLSPSPTEVFLCKLLRARCVMAKILLRARTSGSEAVYDEYLPFFKSLVALLQAALGDMSRDTDCDDNERLPLFSLDLAIIPTLSLTVAKCRDPTTRRQALELLKLCPQHEGLWDAQYSYRVSQASINFEEHGIDDITHPSAIPEQRRIYFTQYVFSTDTNGWSDHVLIVYKPFLDCTGWREIPLYI